MAYNREEIMRDRILLGPDNLKLRIGETKQLQLITDLTDIRWETGPNHVCEFNSETRDIKGLATGDFSIKCIGIKSDGNETSSTITIIVEEAEDSKPLRIMMHNRNTNRLVTVVNKPDPKEDITYKLPKKTGTLMLNTKTERNPGALVIHTPTILKPTEDKRTGYKGILEASPFQTRSGYLGTHTHTEWQYSLDEYFSEKNILDTIKYETGDLTKGSTVFTGLSLYIRVRYGSNEHVSDWSSAIKIDLPASTKEGAGNSIVWGDAYNGGYYGIVPDKAYRGSDDVKNRDGFEDIFVGDWDIIASYNNANGVFNRGNVIKYQGRKYYLNKQTIGSNTIKNNIPTASNIYTLDTREGLPDPANLYFYSANLGLHSHSHVTNAHNYKMGKSIIASENNSISNGSATSVQTGFVNLNLIEDVKLDCPPVKWCNKWIKAIYKGKVIFFLAKPSHYNVSWFDITGAHLAHGLKTIRFGSTLYRWRLLSEEEYRKFIVELPKEQPELKNVIEHWENEIIEDYYTGQVKSVVDLEHNIVGIATNKRRCTYRPVLEVIEEGHEPYKHWANGVGDDSKFQYDEDTDTGYFGIVKQDELTTFENVVTQTKRTTGTNYDFGSEYNVWYKFYWHGIVLYIPPIYKVGLSNDAAWYRNNTFQMPYSYSDLKKTEIEKDGVKYVLSMLSGGGFTSTYQNAVQTLTFDGYGNMLIDLMLRILNTEKYPYQISYINTNGNSYAVSYNKYHKQWSDIPVNKFSGLNDTDILNQQGRCCFDFYTDGYVLKLNNYNPMTNTNKDNDVLLSWYIKSFKETDIPRDYKSRTYYDDMISFEYAELETYRNVTNNYSVTNRFGKYDRTKGQVTIEYYDGRNLSGKQTGTYTCEIDNDGVVWINNKNDRLQILQKLGDNTYKGINLLGNNTETVLISKVKFKDENAPVAKDYTECNNCPVCSKLQLLDGGLNDGKVIEDVVKANLSYPYNLTTYTPLIPREVNAALYTSAKCTCTTNCRYKKK